MAPPHDDEFGNRATSILSTRSESVLGLKLTSEQQIWLGYILPAVVNCAVYIADVSTSVTLAERHLEERNFVIASVTIALIFTPSLVFCGYSIYKRDVHENLKDKTVFVLLRLLNVIAFPAWIIYRYAKQIFWSVEALFQRGHKREEALHFARKPSWAYLHLFLQAFLQSAPQAYFQLCVLLKQYENNYQTDVMHVACILSSLTMLAITVASYQRFESQKVIGRQLPWSSKYWTATDSGKREDNRLSCLVEYDKRMDRGGDLRKPCDDEVPETGGHPDAPHLEPTRAADTVSAQESDGTSESDSTPYLQPKNLHRDLSEDDTTVRVLDEESSPRQVPREGPTEAGGTSSPEPSEPDGGVVTLRKGGGQLNGRRRADEAKDLTVPLMEAPPVPVTNNSTCEPENSSPVIKRIMSMTLDEIHKVKGIDLDEPVGKVIAFTWWLLFLVSRMTTMAVAFQMSHVLTSGILLGQYVATAGVLLYLDHSSAKRILVNLFLSYVYLYALVEYKTRFKRPFLSNVVFFLLLTLEDVAICTVWFFSMDYVEWWETYVFVLIWASLVLSLFSFITYFAILKPKSVIIKPTVYL